MSTEQVSAGDPAWTRQLLENEVSMVLSAISLVERGGAPRVTLAGLHFAEQIVEQYGAEAAEVGVRLEPLYWADDAGCDLVVRRVEHA